MAERPPAGEAPGGERGAERGVGEPPQDPLDSLREHIRATQEAAQRLAQEASESLRIDLEQIAGPPRGGPGEPDAAGGGGSAGAGPGPSGDQRARAGGGGGGQGAGGRGGARTPPSGWDVPRGDSATGELQSVIALLESLRSLLPRELEEQVAEVVRQLLLLLRALIDWLVARIEGRVRSAQPAVEDIPIS